MTVPNTTAIMRLLFKFRILAKQGLKFRIFSVHSHNAKAPHSNENDRIVKYNAKIFSQWLFWHTVKPCMCILIFNSCARCWPSTARGVGRGAGRPTLMGSARGSCIFKVSSPRRTRYKLIGYDYICSVPYNFRILISAFGSIVFKYFFLHF